MQGTELKAIRKQLSMSQEDLAAAIGLSRVTVGLMERDQAPIAQRTEIAVRSLLAERQPTDANLSRAIVDAMVGRMRTLLDQDGPIVLGRDEAIMVLGVMEAVSESMVSQMDRQR